MNVKGKSQPKQTRIPLTLIYNHFCPKISEIIGKSWNLPAINKISLKEIFDCQPITTFMPNKNLKELIGRKNIKKNRAKKYKKANT